MLTHHIVALRGDAEVSFEPATELCCCAGRRQTGDMRRMRCIHLDLWGNKAALGGARLESRYTVLS
jgi:hypothetical protein